MVIVGGGSDVGSSANANCKSDLNLYIRSKNIFLQLELVCKDVNAY